MAEQAVFGMGDMIDALDQARQGFLKHIDGVTVQQAVWKPYSGCKSIAETIDHLLWSDRVLIDVMQSGKEPDYTTAPTAPPADSLTTLLGNLAESHAARIEFLRANYAQASPLMPVNFWGHTSALWQALAGLSNEESYHSGQVAYIRMATDPNWDYYSHIYSGPQQAAQPGESGDKSGNSPGETVESTRFSP